MSALAVILNRDKKPVDPNLLERMTQPVKHLGPDGIHYLIEGHIGFAFLASHITPESINEQQPLKSEDGRFILAADARIDNRPELLSDLRSFLPDKEITTDPDLILAAFQKWGDSAPIHLIGDFSFVIWDSIEQQIFAACDALGMRTLYYGNIEKAFCLATEALQILQHPEAVDSLSELALAGWVVNQPDPNISIFEKVPLLPAGVQLSFISGQNPKTHCYWQPDPTNHIRYKDPHDYEAHLHSILTRSIGDRMRTTSNIIAAQLSGGIDSSSIVGLSNSISKQLSKRLITISQTYGTTRSCDETEYIDATVGHLGLEALRFDAEKYGTNDYPEAYSPMPFSPFHTHNPVFNNTLNLVEGTGANVLLTGHGGDEMTMGSPLIYLERLLRGDLRTLKEVYGAAKRSNIAVGELMRRIFISPLVPNNIRRAVYQAKGKKIPSPYPPWATKAAIEKLKCYKHLLSTNNVTFGNRTQNTMWQHLHSSFTLPVLCAQRHAAISSNIEPRHPFMDRRLAEFAFAIPPEYWRRNGFPKWLVRKTLQDVLPEKVCWRSGKTIFNARFTGPIRQKRTLILDILSDNTLGKLGLLDTSKLLDDTLEKLSIPTYNFDVDTCRMITIQAWLCGLSKNHWNRGK